MSTTTDTVRVGIDGHVRIVDSVDGTIKDQHNAIHPQNLSRMFARALANEQNHSIYRIAFGNGGTKINAIGTVTYKTPNDGQAPDLRGWQSRLYNETYSEVIDDSSTKFGTGPGANPAADGTGTGVVSKSVGMQSQVVVTCVLNATEPTSQRNTSLANSAGVLTDFIFDELGLYSAGLPPLATAGTQDVFIGTQVGSAITYLIPFTTYRLQIKVDGTAAQSIAITFTNADVDPVSAQITYVTLAKKINEKLNGAVARVTVAGMNTYGTLQFASATTGRTSQIELIIPPRGSSDYSSWIFANLKTITGDVAYHGVSSSRVGVAGGSEERPDDPSQEQERLLTHLIFDPLLKAKDRVWTITYTLTITVERTT